MTPEQITRKRDQLEAQIRKGRKRYEAARKKVGEIADSVRTLIRQQQRIELMRLIGEQVQIICGGTDRDELKGAPGTLTAVNRTRCCIDFGEAGKFTVSIDLVERFNPESKTNVLLFRA